MVPAELQQGPGCLVGSDVLDPPPPPPATAASAWSSSSSSTAQHQVSEYPHCVTSIAASMVMYPNRKHPSSILAPPTHLYPRHPAGGTQLPGYLADCLLQQGGEGGSGDGRSSSNKKKKKKKKTASVGSSSKKCSKGRPRCVVVSMSALRCCALVPSLRQAQAKLGYSETLPVAKLFAKHQKVRPNSVVLNTRRFLSRAISAVTETFKSIDCPLDLSGNPLGVARSLDVWPGV